MCFEARFRAAHDLITRVAHANGCSDSRLINSVSRHVLSRTSSFANLAALLSVAQQTGRHLAQRSFVATSGDVLIFSCKFDGVGAAGSAPQNASSSAKKRKREAEDRDEDNDERLESARKRLALVCVKGDTTNGSAVSLSSRLNASRNCVPSGFARISRTMVSL